MSFSLELLYLHNFHVTEIFHIFTWWTLQIAGIGTDSQNPSSRGSIAPAAEDDIIVLPVIKPFVVAKKSDSFLDDDILKFLHREVDEEAIETEFNTKVTPKSRFYNLASSIHGIPSRLSPMG